MPIRGPLAFRHNDWQKRDNKFLLVSPYQSSFVWESGVVWAQCYSCPKDSEGHVIIQKDCTCGIYMALTPMIVNNYYSGANSICFGVEALDSDYEHGGGNIWLHEDVDEFGNRFAGFTAPGAVIRFIVDNRLGNTPDHARAIAWTMQKFNVPLISIEDAWGMARLQWLKIQEGDEDILPWLDYEKEVERKWR